MLLNSDIITRKIKRVGQFLALGRKNALYIREFIIKDLEYINKEISIRNNIYDNLLIQDISYFQEHSEEGKNYYICGTCEHYSCDKCYLVSNRFEEHDKCFLLTSSNAFLTELRRKYEYSILKELYDTRKRLEISHYILTTIIVHNKLMPLLPKFRSEEYFKKNQKVFVFINGEFKKGTVQRAWNGMVEIRMLEKIGDNLDFMDGHGLTLGVCRPEIVFRKELRRMMKDRVYTELYVRLSRDFKDFDYSTFEKTVKGEI